MRFIQSDISIGRMPVSKRCSSEPLSELTGPAALAMMAQAAAKAIWRFMDDSPRMDFFKRRSVAAASTRR
jgi:hypothetical protein